MNPFVKKHLISALLTLVSTFSIAFSSVILSVGLDKVDQAALYSAVIAGATAALRAFLKVLTEWNDAQ